MLLCSLSSKIGEHSIHGFQMMHNDLNLLGLLLLSAGIAAIGGLLADHNAALLLFIPKLIPILTFYA